MYNVHFIDFADRNVFISVPLEVWGMLHVLTLTLRSAKLPKGVNSEIGIFICLSVQCKCVTVGNQEEARALVERCLAEFHIQVRISFDLRF